MTPGRTNAARGFTVTELLMTAGIIAVLTAMAIPGLQAVKRRNFESQCIAKLSNIALAEKRYLAQFKEFGSWEELQDAGLLPRGYTRIGAFVPTISARSVKPYCDLYSLQFTIPQTANSLFFQVRAIPARQGMGLRTFNVSLLLDTAGSKDTIYTDPPVREGIDPNGKPVGGY